MIIWSALIRWRQPMHLEIVSLMLSVVIVILLE